MWSYYTRRSASAKAVLGDSSLIVPFLEPFALFTSKAISARDSKDTTHVRQVRDYGSCERRPSQRRRGRVGRLHYLVILHAGSDTYKHARLLKNPGREGLGDTTVGATARLLMDASKLALSFDYTAKLPTGDSSKRLSSGQVDHAFTATFDRDLTSKLSLEVELADYIAGQGQGKALHYFTPDMTVAYAFDDRNSLEVEVDATPAAHGDPTDISAIVRYARPVGNRFQMTAGLQAGLTPYNSKIGVVVRFRFKGSLRGER